jgi:hypothetical protein
MMVESTVDGLEHGLQVAVVDCPTKHLVKRRRQMQSQSIAVAVQAPPPVALRRLHKLQGALETLLLPDSIMDTVVMTARGGGLVNGDTRKDREVGVQTFPDPARQHLARRIFQAGDVVQTGVIELGVKRRPNGLDQVEIDAHIAVGKVLVRVEDDLEAVSVHATALMPFGHIGQTMGRLETKAPPHVGLVGAIEIGPLVRGALDSDRDDPGDVQVCAHPARQILVGRDRQMLIEVAVIERRDAIAQCVR